MRIPISLCTLLFVNCITNLCYVASNDVAKVINGTWVVIMDQPPQQDGNQGLKTRNTIEERQWISNKKIVQKFNNRQTYIDGLKNKVSVLENLQQDDPTALLARLSVLNEEITTLQANQNYIKSSLEVKCKYLDRLLDPERHCCLSTDGFHVTCVSNFLTTTEGFEFPDDHAAGDCPTCPSGLQSSWGNSGHKENLRF